LGRFFSKANSFLWRPISLQNLQQPKRLLERAFLPKGFAIARKKLKTFSVLCNWFFVFRHQADTQKDTVIVLGGAHILITAHKPYAAHLVFVNFGGHSYI